MTLGNCKRCGTLYLQTRTPYCSDCQTVQNEMYIQVRDYVKRNPKSTMLDIHENTGIPIAKLLELNKEDYVPFGR
ncbi:hypothetical protein [Paenibacillus sp. MBLB4367]|uniref:hypothetical protein n=1 Tax=Paenibacillus sp. MBLB4367 TaxID=3384767 RepID=UPI003908158B